MQDDKYAIYLRKSREDRELEKYDNVDTLYRHRNALESYAKVHGLTIEHIYEEVVTGETIENRPQMKLLLKDVESNKWAGVLVMEVQRLARGDTEDQGIVAKTFKYSNTKIITPSKTYNPNNEEDEEYFEFGLFMSRREYKAITKRQQRGRIASVNEGKYVASIPPFGYKRKKLENSKGYTLEVEPKEAEIVKQIFNIFAYQEISINGVAKTINNLGLKPRIADKWTISSIKDILNNPVYIGKIRWNARKQVYTIKNGKRIKHRPRNANATIIDGLHPPLINEEIWNIVQNKRTVNSAPVQHNNVVQNPLVGIVYCEKCGKLMQRRPYKKANKPATLICSNKECDNISSKLFIVEDKIIQALKIWLKSYTIDYEELNRLKKKAKVVTDKDILNKLQSDLEKEKIKQNKIYDLFEEGVYDKEVFKERIAKVNETIKELECKIKTLKQKVEAQENIEEEQKLIIPKIENVLDVYYKLETAEQKNILLKTILEKVTYLKTEKAIKKNSDASNFEIHIYPKIPKI